LAGPGLGLFVIFVVNLLSAAIGHGGWGLVGTNTIINLSEIVTAFYIFIKTKPRLEIFTMRAVAAIGGLIVGDVFFLIVILVSGTQGTELRGVAPDRLPDPGPDIKSDRGGRRGSCYGFVVEYLSKVRPDLLVQ